MTKSEDGGEGESLPLPPPKFVDEHGLTAFRNRFLTRDFLLGELAIAPSGVLAGTFPVGVGKSFALDGILGDPATFEQFDLVIYAAPTWRIIFERPIANGTAVAPVEHLVLHPRPRLRCGSLDPRWQRLERAGNAAVGREDVCPTCRHYASNDPCPYPGRFRPSKWKKPKLALTTEEHFNKNRDFVPFIASLAKAERVLLLLDEAQIASAPFEITLMPHDLSLFRQAVALAAETDDRLDPEMVGTWLGSQDTLMRAGDEGLADDGWRFPRALNRHAAAIQRAGLAIDPDFRYLGHDLALFPGSRPEERSRGEDGRVRFTARPRLDAKVLIMAANTRPEFIAHRLGIAEVTAPFDGLRVTHSGTRVFNLKSALGMKKFFWRNAPQILGLAATVVARNLLEGRTTVLVSRKDEKERCAGMLAGFLAQLPLPAVRFVTDEYDALGAPDPAVVPIIHYGMVGVNTFEHYETAYSLNSFYVPDHALDQSLQGHEPDRFAVAVHVRTDAAGNRRVAVTDPAHAGSGLDRLGDLHLRKLEVDPAIQALGRVRFFTRPREVLFFQMHDLAPEVEAVELRTLEAARLAFGVPKFGDLRVAAGAARLRAMRSRGLTLAAAAAKVGIHPETARRWLASSFPFDLFKRAFAAAAEAETP